MESGAFYGNIRKPTAMWWLLYRGFGLAVTITSIIDKAMQWPYIEVFIVLGVKEPTRLHIAIDMSSYWAVAALLANRSLCPTVLAIWHSAAMMSRCFWCGYCASSATKVRRRRIRHHRHLYDTFASRREHMQYTNCCVFVYGCTTNFRLSNFFT